MTATVKAPTISLNEFLDEIDAFAEQVPLDLLTDRLGRLRIDRA